MSSDLWQAFGDSSHAEINPWGQAAATSASSVLQDTVTKQTNRPGLDLLDQSSSGTRRRSQPYEVPAKETLQDDAQSDADADSWSAVNDEIQNAWTDTNSKQVSASQTPPRTTHRLPNTSTQELLDSDDDFGDFEDAEPLPATQHTRINTAITNPQPSYGESIEPNDDFGDFGDFEAVGVEEANITALTSVTSNMDSFTTNSPLTERLEELQGLSTSTKPKETPYDPFGDLEQLSRTVRQANVTSTTSISSHTHSFDPFADLDELSRPADKVNHKTTPLKAREFPAGHKVPNTNPPQSILKNNTPQPSVPVEEVGTKTTEALHKHPALSLYDAMMEDEAWDEFPEDEECDQSANMETITAKSVIQDASSSKEQPRTPSKPLNGVPPSNIPPPSILISLISGLVQRLPEELEQIMFSSESPSNPREGEDLQLQKRLGVLRVTARVTAGRKLRWKRDMILSQNMKMGPAGKPGGMKLVGVDKAEIKREDREVAEIVRIWKQTSGSIRAAAIKLHSKASKQPLVLPQIGESMLVRILKPSDGGIKSTKCCVLCGLRRDERVDKVDVDIWDQFGEWWTEHWGHAECRIFWESHGEYFQQRS